MSNETLRERIQTARAMSALDGLPDATRKAWANQLQMDVARLEQQESQDRYNKQLAIRRA